MLREQPAMGWQASRKSQPSGKHLSANALAACAMNMNISGNQREQCFPEEQVCLASDAPVAGDLKEGFVHDCPTHVP